MSSSSTPVMSSNVPSTTIVGKTSSATSIATTSASETTRMTAPPPEPKISLVFKVQQNFTAELGNTSSPEFKALKNKVSSALDQVYSAQYGTSFNRTVIKGFSQGSVVVDAELVFNDVSSLPNTSSVAETLVSAASSSNFSLSVNTSSIVVQTVSTPTQAPAETTFATSLTSQGTTTIATATTTTQSIDTTSVHPTTSLQPTTSTPDHTSSQPMTTAPVTTTVTLENATNYFIAANINSRSHFFTAYDNSPSYHNCDT
ncbi:cell wall protein DAN4-like [Notolabrus celidotus]|nr:cell wall protein DAN4-like [Notolabrus celidotus]